jgi:transposase
MAGKQEAIRDVARTVLQDPRGMVKADSLKPSYQEVDVAILCRTHGDKSNHASEEVCSMSQPTTRKYPAAFKERAVKLAVESEQPIAQTARDLGVNENTLHTWIGKYHRVERQEKEVNDEHLYEELKRLRKENARLQEERDIVKKAAAYFAQQLP